MARDHVKRGAALPRGRQRNAKRGASKSNRPEFPDRDLAILKDRLYRCRTYRGLGDEHGITAERVRQILNRSVRLISNAGQAITGLQARVEELAREVRVRDRLLAAPARVYLSWERLLDKNIEELPFSTRVSNALERREVCTLGELWDQTDAEILSWSRIGTNSLTNLRDVMVDYFAAHGWEVRWKRTNDRMQGHMERLGPLSSVDPVQNYGFRGPSDLIACGRFSGGNLET